MRHDTSVTANHKGFRQAAHVVSLAHDIPRVEQDPEEMVTSLRAAMAQAGAALGERAGAIVAAGIAMAMEIGLLGVKSLGERLLWIAPAMYLISIIPGAIAAFSLRPRLRRRPAALPVGA